MTPIDILILILAVIAVGLLIFVKVRQHKNGVSCCGGCANCPAKRKCTKNKEQTDE